MLMIGIMVFAAVTAIRVKAVEKGSLGALGWFGVYVFPSFAQVVELGEKLGKVWKRGRP